jgi:prepilin-type processing-associated H-X9-DG protein
MSGPQVAIAAGMLLPALSRARQKAREVACSSNLKQIGVALMAYATDHGEQRPASLAELVPRYMPPTVLKCPSDGVGIPKIRGGNPCSYCYVGSIPTKEGFADLIVACSRLGVHRGGRNVLHYDGRVQWMTEVDFKTKLGRQAKDFWRPLMQRNPAGVDKARVDAFLAGQPYNEGP